MLSAMQKTAGTFILPVSSPLLKADYVVALRPRILKCSSIRPDICDATSRTPHSAARRSGEIRLTATTADHSRPGSRLADWLVPKVTVSPAPCCNRRRAGADVPRRLWGGQALRETRRTI